MIKLYPSSATFNSGVQPDAKYNNSCFRFQVVDAHTTTRANIPEVYQTIGALDEIRFGRVLEQRGYSVEREVPLKVELSNGLWFSGRKDFDCVKDGERLIVEKKSSISKKVQTMINKREVNHQQLAQLVSYLVLDNVKHGLLVVTFYKFAPDLSALEVGAEAEYKIEIDGRSILVDNEVYKYTVDDLSRYYKWAGHYKMSNEIADRPKNFAQRFKSPCTFCPLSVHCTQYDSGAQTDQEFIEIGAQIIDKHNREHVPKEPEIFLPKGRKTTKRK